MKRYILYLVQVYPQKGMGISWTSFLKGKTTQVTYLVDMVISLLTHPNIFETLEEKKRFLNICTSRNITCEPNSNQMCSVSFSIEIII